MHCSHFASAALGMIEAPVRRISPVMVEHAIEELRSRYGEQLEADASQVPARGPFRASFFTKDEARIWIERPQHSAVVPEASRVVEWQVYSREGPYLESLYLPLAALPTSRVRNGRIVGVQQDENGVEVVVYDLRR